jgi:glycosyltransferase involved in cell wall biosynthesis
MGYDASRAENGTKTRFLDAAKGVAPIRNAVMIGNYPPRKCGIATFTRDAFDSLRDQLPDADWSLVAMDDGKADYQFPGAVTHVIPQDDAEAYAFVAEQLNQSGAEVAFIQHEFGIYGGEAGSHILKLMRRLRMPVVVTLHTVLENPNPAQKRVMDEILERASAAIVMTEMGADILARVHRIGPAKVHVIPHGAPERPFASPEAFKAPLGLWGHKVLMTFGLLSPNKGVETIIRGLPEILSRHPDALYVVVGATHPHLLARDGEAYRDSLVELATSLGVAENLRFVNRFVGDKELVDLLQAADLYVTPYLTEAQITSGTLAYAIALGRPVISTPYWHAREALADGVGVLCRFGDAAGFAREITRLLSDQIRREAMARRAYKAGEPSRWTKVAAAAVDLAVSCRAEYRRDSEEAFRSLACPAQHALLRISDDCGILQHSSFSVPNRDHGYCTDDTARGLNLVARLQGDGEAGRHIIRLGYTCAAFVNHAWNAKTGQFRNFMGFNRSWLDDGGSDDCCARALEALCLAARHFVRPDLRDWAISLAREAFRHADQWQAIRARALIIKALIAGEGVVLETEETCRLLEQHALVLSVALAKGKLDGHGWFEVSLSYDNARLPEALILAGRRLGDSGMISDGLAALDHVMERQTSTQGWFCPIATSSFDDTSAQHPVFDQQPIEALATIDACLVAWRATGDPKRVASAESVFRWFGGDNVHGIALTSAIDGGCHDGLTVDGLNRNQGAESILSYHLAAAAMRDVLRQRAMPI